jgi:cytochrome oxidase Cu insertion factor (SCO1/SenC/PrrC family)
MPVAFDIALYAVARRRNPAPRAHSLDSSQFLLRHSTPQRRVSARAAGPLLLILALLGTAVPQPGAALQLSELPASWVDDRGQAFDLRTLQAQGHAVVLTMAYATCHRVCPMTVSRLRQMQRDYDRRGVSVEFLVVGYDPESDDPAAWHRYRLTRQLTRDNWHFLVGTRAAVEQLAGQLGFNFWKYDQHVMHGSRIVQFDMRGALVAGDESTGSAEHTEVGQ